MSFETTDPELLNRVKDFQDKEAWEHFVEKYKPRIIKHCCTTGLDVDQAEEVFQETLIHCCRYLPALKYSSSVGKFRSWLNLQVNQQISNHFRKATRSEKTKQSYIQFVNDFNGVESGSQSSPSQYEYDLITMAAQRTKTLIDPIQWQIFEAYVLFGLKSKEVGSIFGVSEINVRVISMRVKSKLRSQWKQMQDEPF